MTGAVSRMRAISSESSYRPHSNINNYVMLGAKKVNGYGFQTDGVDGLLTASARQNGPLMGAIHERDYDDWPRDPMRFAFPLDR
jgi:hypothetical protein